MVDMFQALGIKSHIQMEAVGLLSGTASGFMRSDLFRERLIKALAHNGDSAIFLPRINTEVESLVGHQFLVRRNKRGVHEIGLNKIIWRLPADAINSIREATTFIMVGNLFPPNDFDEVKQQVKYRLRAMKASCRQVSDAAFEILVSKFSANRIH